MHEFVGKIKDVKGALLKIDLFNIMLDAASVFLFLSILAFVTGASLYYAFPITLIFIGLRLRKRREVFSALEGRYEGFRERLEAAYDNRNEDSLIVQDLSDEVSGEMDEVRYSAFISRRQSAFRVLLPVLLSFVIILLAFADIEPVKLPSIDFSRDAVQVQGGLAEGGVGIEGVAAGVEEDIFGKASIPKIEGREVDLALLPGGGEIRIRESTERGITSTGEAPEFLPAEAFGEDFPKKYEEVLKRYFEAIAEEG